MENEVYAKMIKWTESYVYYRSFLVLWSDHTWDEFRFASRPKIYNYKKFLNLGCLTNRKVTREEAIKYITNKIEELGP